MKRDAASLAARLAANADAVRKEYLSQGRRSGNYWLAGDVRDNPGRSLFVRLAGPAYGRSTAGKWTANVAAGFMLWIGDWVLSHSRLTASTQHNASALREVA
jgi:hypothetical protein